MSDRKTMTAACCLMPEIGSATQRFVFPQQNPELALKGLRGDDRIFAQAELAVARCDFALARKLHGQLSQSPRYLATASRIGVIAAIGLRDLGLFDEIIRKLDIMRRTSDDVVSTVRMDLVTSWIHQWMWIPTGYPEWICRFDYENVPEHWRDIAVYLSAKIRLVRDQYESAYTTAALMMNYVPMSESISARDAHLWILRAVACRETGRRREMMKCLGEVVQKLAPHGMLLPLLPFMHGSAMSPVEELLAKVRPDLTSRYRELAKTYLTNVIYVRNHYLGEHVTDKLSLREMYLAMLLKRGMAYGELAERFGITTGRLKNVVSKIYEKLGIHGRSELKDLVW